MTSFSLCFPNIGAKHLDTGSLTPKAQVLVVAFKAYQGWQRPLSQLQSLPLWPPKAWEPESLLQMQSGGPLGQTLENSTNRVLCAIKRDTGLWIVPQGPCSLKTSGPDHPSADQS